LLLNTFTEQDIPRYVALGLPAPGTPGAYIDRVEPRTQARRLPDGPSAPLPAWTRDLPAESWRSLNLGNRAESASRFAAQRLWLDREEEWVIAEWPANRQGPASWWRSNLPTETSLEELVGYALLCP
jgi:hypothetical protein